MPTCSRSSLRGQQAAGTAESVRTGQQPSGERSLRTVRVHSRRIRQPALSLQRQPHCSTNQDERQLERRGGDKQRDKQECREANGREDKLLLSFLLSRVPMKLTLLPAYLSCYLTTFPPIPSVGYMPFSPLPHLPSNPSDSLSPEPPTPPPPIHSSFCSHPSLPPSLPISRLWVCMQTWPLLSECL